MLHKVVEILAPRSRGKLYTYFLDNSPEMDPERKRPVVLICPGGGYSFTSDREAEPVAIRWNALGFHAAVLRYTVAPGVFPAALEELALAVAHLRAHREEYHIDGDKILIAGFSAGGHLAASLGVFWHREFLSEGTGVRADEIKPNGLILAYPVITSGEYCHEESFRNLLGGRFEETELRELVSLEKQVDSRMPPVFLWHTVEDALVPMENSMTMAWALGKNSIPFELHLYPRGVHGLSLGTEETRSSKPEKSAVCLDVENWIDMAARWVRNL